MYIISIRIYNNQYRFILTKPIRTIVSNVNSPENNFTIRHLPDGAAC